VNAKADATWKKVQIGVGYNIENIGLARVQYVGNTFNFTQAPSTPAAPAAYTVWGQGVTPNFARIEGAFKVTALENIGVKLDVGAKFPLPITTDEDDTADRTVWQDNLQVNTTAQYALGDLGVQLALYSAFGGSVKNVDKPDDQYAKIPLTVIAYLTPSYYLSVIDAKVGVEFGLTAVGETREKWGSGDERGREDQYTLVGFGAWVDKSLGKGLVKVGVAYTLPATEHTVTTGAASGDGQKTKGAGVLSVPIILEYSF